MMRRLWKSRELLWSLAWRELTQRYKGSFLGLLWAVLVPLVMLVVYTFVFSVVFKAKWPSALSEDTSTVSYALILLAGLIPFNVFSEVTNRSPWLVLNAPNYVKKVIFPLEILPPVVLASSLLHSFISVVLIFLGNLILYGKISSTLYLLPLAYLPLVFLCLGIGWFLSSLGVYIRDIGQAINVIIQMLFFVSPVFYSADAVPQRLQFFFKINPLSTIISGFRNVLLWGKPLSWGEWIFWTVFTFLFATIGYLWFIKTRKGFADVL